MQLLLYSRLLINSNLSVNSYLTHQTQSLIYKTVCKSQETNRGKKAVFKVQIRKETINNLSSSKPQSYNAQNTHITSISTLISRNVQILKNQISLVRKSVSKTYLIDTRLVSRNITQISFPFFLKRKRKVLIQT